MKHKRGHILIVDDEENILSSLEGILSDEGYIVSKAENGDTALDIIKADSPDLVILDIWIPGIDGIQTLKNIKDLAPEVEVVMMSGHGTIETAVKATKMGAFDFIEKPLSMENILNVVKAALKSRIKSTKEAKNSKQEEVKGHEKGRHLYKKNKKPENSIDQNGYINNTENESTGKMSFKTGKNSNEQRQHTLQRSVVLCGQGLHSGLKTGMILSPLPPNSGILFEDISTGETIPAYIDFVESSRYAYATTIKNGAASVKTIEHIMAVLHMYRITNLLIKMGDEVPIMDGSAVDFCQLIEDGGIEEQKPLIDEIIIGTEMTIDADHGKSLIVTPSDTFSVSYYLNYPHPVGVQEFKFCFQDSDHFKKEIAPARTFGFVKDIEKMEEAGLASGGKLSNFILLDDEKVINTTLRFNDEFVRHKILDIIGDFYLLGRPILGHIKARMTGHYDNLILVKKIKELYL